MKSPKFFLTVAMLLLFKLSMSQQRIKLRGRVMVEGIDIPIANATVKWDRYAVVTNENGFFQLEVPPLDTIKLVVSHLEYKSVNFQVPDSGKDELFTIHLLPNKNQLNEVMVSTGYQLLPRERATGSFEHIDNSLFNRQIGVDVISRLDGIANSVLFDKRDGSTQNFSIRGLSSIGDVSQRQPLIIVDDFPYEGDINNLNPNDIESIDLLKDAAAASIWGARAGNGVLVIRTKKGKKEQQTQIGFVANSTFIRKPDLFYIPVMESSDYIGVERMLFEQGYYDADLNNITNRPVVTPAVEILNRIRNETLDVRLGEQQLRNLGANDIRNDLSRYFYRTGINQQYALNLSGGSKHHNFRISGGFDTNEGTEVGNGYDRFTLGTSQSVTFSPAVELNASLNYTNSRSFNNQVDNINLGYREVYPYAKLVGENGEPLILEQYYRRSYLESLQDMPLLDWYYRPLDELHLNDNVRNLENLLFKVSANVKISKVFNLDLRYQYETQKSRLEDYRSVETFYTRNLINRYANIGADGSLIQNIPLGGILDQSFNDFQSHGARGQLNMNKDWKGGHSLHAIAGSEIRERVTQLSSNRTYGFDKDLMVGLPADYVTRFPQFDNLAGASSIQNNQSFGKFTNVFISLYANASYTYHNRYILSASARRDASNVFGVRTNDRWKPLWSVGAAWNITNEAFFASELLADLKLRATYGASGNVNNSISSLTTINYFGTSPLSNYQQASIRNPPNELLRWENVEQLNLGLDFSLKKSSLSGSIEFYSKQATDLLSSVPTDLTTGFRNLTMNAAAMRTQGVDITLNGRYSANDFSWEPNALFSYNNEKLTRYLFDVARPSNYVSLAGVLSPIEGRNAYNLVSYRWAGLDAEGSPQGYINRAPSNVPNEIVQNATLDDLVFHGSLLPRYFGALRNTFSYRDLSLSVNITYRFKYFFRRPSINYGSLFGGTRGHADFYERWQQPGDELLTNVPSMVYPNDARRDEVYRYSEVTAERGDHIRLQDINISYQPRLTSLRQLKQLRFTLYANNLMVLWQANKQGIDPDFPEFNAPRSISLGVSANF